MAFFDEFRRLKIRLEDIKSATDNFSDSNLIGRGGFGKVYKGAIFHSKGRGMAAFKRLDSRYGQGNSEFWKEIMMLSRFTHENLVSLLGFCDEGGEKILVYEYVSRGSLDRHLSSSDLTWTQRLKICLAVARGLNYLHDPKGAHQRVLHRDVKSSNILLNENWNAKFSDLGLSKIGPANQQYTALISNVVGTIGYLDPLYMEMGLLTKESDVYSFGVVLFEVLCGRLCYEGNKGRCDILVHTWKQSYKQKKVDEIIFEDLLHQMDSVSLETFSDIAFQCLQRSREKRPTMAEVVKKLESALEFQEIYEQLSIYEQPTIRDEVVKAAVRPLIYKSKQGLVTLLSKGILVHRGTTWISLNKNEEVCEMISVAECLIPVSDDAVDHHLYPSKESRFAEGNFLASIGRFRAHVMAQFLSPGTTYTINLVFRFYTTRKDSSKPTLLGLKYKLEEETKSSISYLADEREDGWMTIELYQFTCNTRTFTAKILFEESRYGGSLLVEGIEFRPLEREEHEENGDVDINLVPDLDFEWELKLPNDYKEIIKWSKDRTKFATTKELYFHFRKGFLINNIKKKEWFSLAKKDKKCRMLSARTVLIEIEWSWKRVLESRFKEAAFDPNVRFSIVCKTDSHLLSPQTTYACYLVYKITKNHSNFEDPVEVTDKHFHFNDSHKTKIRFIHFLSPQTPVIGLTFEENTSNLTNMPKHKGLPLLRNDGWMEVQIWEFQTTTTIEMISMHFYFNRTMYRPFSGLIVQGIEFKPL